MNQGEFLSGLREALENELSGQAVQENVQYYRDYIEEEVRNGRQEEEVLSELGDPWLIARTVIDTPNAGRGYQKADDSYVKVKENSSNQERRVRVFGLDTWWKKLLALLAVVGIFMGVIAIITGILSLVLPILVPVLVIIMIVKIFSKK